MKSCAVTYAVIIYTVGFKDLWLEDKDKDKGLRLKDKDKDL